MMRNRPIPGAGEAAASAPRGERLPRARQHQAARTSPTTAAPRPSCSTRTCGPRWSRRRRASPASATTFIAVKGQTAGCGHFTNDLSDRPEHRGGRGGGRASRHAPQATGSRRRRPQVPEGRAPLRDARCRRRLRPLRVGRRAPRSACPLYHGTAFAFHGHELHARGDVRASPRTDRSPEAFTEHIERYCRVTTTAVVPTMLHRPVAHEVTPADTRSLRAIFTAGAPLPAPLAVDVMTAGDVLFNFYGATETGLVFPRQARRSPRRAGDIGRLIPGNEIRLLGDDRREGGRGAGERDSTCATRCSSPATAGSRSAARQRRGTASSAWATSPAPTATASIEGASAT